MNKNCMNVRIYRAGRDGSFQLPYCVPSIIAGREMIKRESMSDHSGKHTFLLIDCNDDTVISTAFDGSLAPGIPNIKLLVEYSSNGKPDMIQHPITKLMDITNLQDKLNAMGL